MIDSKKNKLASLLRVAFTFRSIAKVGSETQDELHETKDKVPDVSQSVEQEKPKQVLQPEAKSEKNIVKQTVQIESDQSNMSGILTAKSSLEIRNDVRDYIRNDRDTMLRKWMALNETLRSEDRRRDQSIARDVKSKTRLVPPTIQKIIKILKLAVKNTVSHPIPRGGNPYNVIKQTFIYWDVDKKGELDEGQFQSSLNALGVKLSTTDKSTVMAFYSSSEGKMSYKDFLDDINREEPSLTEMRETPLIITPDGTTLSTARAPMPQIVKLFLDAVHYGIQSKILISASTAMLLRQAFQVSEADEDSSLDARSLMRCANSRLGLQVHLDQAQEIVRYYDIKQNGRLDYRLFVTDVLSGFPKFLHQEGAEQGRSKSAPHSSPNPFIPQKFHPVANKTLEKFKVDLRLCLDARVKAKKGTMRSWLRETFVKWDTQYIGRIKDWRSLQGVIHRLGLFLTEEEARTVMHHYDKDGVGTVDYNLIIDDVVVEEPSILEDGCEGDRRRATTATSRAPRTISHTLDRIRRAVEAFGRKSGGVLSPLDVLNGTFLRHDPSVLGRVSPDVVLEVFRELRVKCSDEELTALVTWFDSNSSNLLDYPELIRQLWGEDPGLVAMRRSLNSLPSISSPTSKLSSSLLNSAGSTFEGSAKNAAPDPYLKETKRQKEVQILARRKEMAMERALLQQKLQEVERQKKAVMDHYLSTGGRTNL